MLYSNYLNEKALPGSNISAGNLIDLDLLGNQINHDHSRNFQVNSSQLEGEYAIMGTRRHLKRELKEKAERDRLAAQKQQIY